MKNKTLFFLEACAACGVCFIHVQFPGMFGQLLNAVSRCGVALFFLISGYFSYNSNGEVVYTKLKVKLHRNLRLLFASYCLYLCWNIVGRLLRRGFTGVWGYLRSVFSVSSIYRFLVWQNDPIAGHLWFLQSLVLCYLLMMVIVKKERYQTAYRLFFSFLIMQIVISGVLSVCHIETVPLYVLRNVWFYGMPVFLIGYWIASQNEVLTRLSDYRLGLGVILGLAMTLAGRLLIGNLQLYFGTIILLFSVFMLAIKHPQMNFPKFVVKMGAEYSGTIYTIHWLIKEIWRELVKTMKISGAFISWGSPIIVLGISVVVAIILEKLKSLRRERSRIK